MNYAVGNDLIATYRGRKPKSPKPRKNKFLVAQGDCEKSSVRLKELQDRALFFEMAEKTWGSLPKWKRVLLSLIGEDANSYYASKG